MLLADGKCDMAAEQIWYVYIVRCADDTLYTGMTNHPEQRLKMHNDGRGAKYTRGRGPVSLVYCEQCESRSAALRREACIKGMSRREKLLLIHSKEES